MANSKTTQQNFIPNVKPKSDPKEAARIQAMMGHIRNQNAQVVSDEVDQTKTLEKKEAATKEGGGIDLKTIPTVYFTNCKGGKYVVDHKITKVFVENCHDTEITFNGQILTSTVEAWKCTNVTINCNTKVKTLQLDISNKYAINFKRKEDYHSIIWQDVEEIDINFEDSPVYNKKCGFVPMREKYPDSDMKIDQFIIRFVTSLGDKLTSERCCRLKNGFLSTDREAEEWEKRNQLAKERYMSNFLKEAGITLNKSQVKKTPNNAPCPCSSGKKYKKCCMNKKQLTGVEGGKSFLDVGSKK